MGRFKRILLINPPNVRHVLAKFKTIPLGLLYLSSYLRQYNHSTVNVVDGSVEGKKAVIKRIKDFKPDLVGISCLTISRHESFRMAAIAKKVNSNCKIVLGGIHPTIMWQQIMEHYPQIDYIVRGEGEITLSELVRGKKISKINGLVWRRKNKKVVYNPDRELITDLDKLPFPAWDMLNLRNYPPVNRSIANRIDLSKEIRYSIIFSRGCMGRCTFCSSWRIWRGYRYRSADNVMKEIELLVHRYNAKHIAFEDDTLTGNKAEIIKFCKGIIKRKIKVAIHCMTRVDCIDARLLKWMKKAGFYGISYGIESGSPVMLIKMNKKTDLNMIIRATKLTRQNKIKFETFMMYGMPGETVEDRALSEILLREIRPDYISTMGEVLIFPGTALYEQAKNAKLINDDYWLSNRPFYIYRGGIGNDPINQLLKAQDFVNSLIYNTVLEKPATMFFTKILRLQYKISLLRHFLKNQFILNVI
jgi:radical SAM superfamily enzyme YgiQ (UPF0313 family)